MKSESIDLVLVEVGAALRRLRLQRNLTQQVIADRSGVSFNTVGNLEQGKGASLRSFLAICRTLGKVDWIKTLPPPMGMSPIEMLKRADRPVRQRASAMKCDRHG